jgi:exonuclease SbcC
MGLDEVTVDFASLNGIIVFSAPNGSGKTTILDSLHPYRLMPYRAGNTYRPTGFSYYDHTYGDAVKVFIFEVDGVKYKSKVPHRHGRKKAEGTCIYGVPILFPEAAKAAHGTSTRRRL